MSTTTLHPTRPKVHLDIVLAHNGTRWVARCLQLGVVAAGETPDDAFTDIQKVCAAQIGFALEHNRLDGLFRPPDPLLYAQMLHGRQVGIFDIDIDVRFANEPIQQPVEFQRTVLQAA